MSEPDEIDENTPSPENQRGKIKHRITALLEKLEKIQGLALIVAAIALGGDLYWKLKHEYPALEAERTAQAAEREDAAVAREMQAWEHLARKAVGIDGYDVAIQYLLERRGILTGLDMSCEAFTGKQFENKRSLQDEQRCDEDFQFVGWKIKGEVDTQSPLWDNETETILSKFNANQSNFTLSSFLNISLSQSNFIETYFLDSKLENSVIGLSDFSYATFQGFSLKGTKAGDSSIFYDGDTVFRNSRFVWTDMTDFNCNNCVLEGATFSGLNLSNANLKGAVGLIKEQFNDTVWAWDDSEPSLPDYIPPIHLCDARLREYLDSPYFRPAFENGKFELSYERPEGCGDWQWRDWTTKNVPIGTIFLLCDPAEREMFYGTPKRERSDPPLNCKPVKLIKE